MNCINKKLPEFIKLSEAVNINPLVLAAKIGVWQSENTLDRFPTAEEILTYDKPEINSQDNVLYQKSNDDIKINTPIQLLRFLKLNASIGEIKPGSKGISEDRIIKFNKRLQSFNATHHTNMYVNFKKIGETNSFGAESILRFTPVTIRSKKTEKPSIEESEFYDYAKVSPEEYTKDPDLDVNSESYIEEYQLSNSNSSVINKKLNEKLLNQFDKLGISTKAVDSIKDSKGRFVDANAVANIFGLTIQYVEGKLQEDTLAEEGFHFMTEIVKVNNRALYNSMVYNIKKQPEYAEVKEEYADTYETEQQFIDEAIGKVGAKILTSGKETKTTRNIWNKIVGFIKDLFAKFGITSDAFSQSMSSYMRAAELFMDDTNIGEYSEVLKGIKKKSNGITYYQLTPEVQAQYESNFNNLSIFNNTDKSPIIKTDKGFINRSTGDVIKNDAADRIISKTKIKEGDELLPLHQIKIKAFLDVLGKNYSEDKPKLSYTEARKIVKERLISTSKFKDYNTNSKIWDLGYNDSMSLESFEELQNGIIKVIDDIQLNDEKMRHVSGSENNTKLFFSLPLYDEMNDEAGIVDMLVLHPDGSIGMYDFESMSFRTEGSMIIYPDIRIEDEFKFGTKMSAYKDILTANFGKGTVFAETRVIPIQTSINYKKKESMSFARMGSDPIDGTEAIRVHLKHITVADETTGHKTIDNALKGIYKLRDNLVTRSKKKNPSAEQLSIDVRLKKVRELIKSVIIYPKLKSLTNEVTSLRNEFNTKLNANTSANDMLIAPDIKEYYSYAVLYADLLKGLRDNALESSKTAETKESKTQYKESANKINGLMWDLDRFITELEDKRLDILNQEHAETDLSAKYRKLGGAKAQFAPLSEFNNPYFKMYSKEVTIIEQQIQDAIDSKTGEIKDVYDGIVNFSKNNNISVDDIYKKIINPNNGKLVWKYNKEFYDKLRTAIEKKDTAWLLKNSAIKKYGDTFKYTGDSLVDFNRRKAIKEAELKSKFPYSNEEGFDVQNENFKNARDHQMDIWNKNHDITLYPDAIFNTYNKIMSLDDIESNYSNEWKFIINNNEIKALYDMWVGLNTLAEEYTGKQISPNYLPEIQRDIVEAMTNNGLPQTMDIVQQLRDSLYAKENDATRGSVDINTGEQIQGITLLYHNSMIMNLKTKTEIPIIEKQLLAEDFIQGSEEYKVEFNKRIRVAERKKAVAFKSKDLVRSAQLWVGAIYTYHYYKEREAFANLLVDHMRTANVNPIVTNSQGSPMLGKVSLKAKTALGVSGSEVEDLQKFINLYHYGQKVQGYDKLIPKDIKDSKGNIVDTKYVSVTKAVKTSMSIMSAKALALNLFSGIGNTIGVLSNLYFLKAENREITKEGYDAAREMYKNDRETYQALNEIIKPYAHNINFETANKVSANKLSRVMTLDHMYFMMKHPDEFIDRTLTVTLAHTYGINNLGKVVRIATNEGAKPIIEFLSKQEDGSFKLDLSVAQRADFKKKVQATATKIKGSIPQADKALWSTNIIMNVLMQFKSWMPGLISTRFKELGFSNTMEEFDVGRFRVVWGELFKSGFNFKNFGNIINRMLPFYARRSNGDMRIDPKVSQIFLEEFKAGSPEAYDELVDSVKARFPNMSPTEIKAKILQEFIELREAKVNAFVQEVKFLTMMYLVMLGAGKLAPDDDDELGKFATRNLQQALYRGYMELSFFYSPKTITDLMKTPAPVVTRTLKSIYQLSNNMIQESTDFIKGVDNKQDKTPMGYYTIKNIPGINQIQSLFNENHYFSK